MNGYNFTERVRKLLALAREAAAKRRHEYVAPEHMLIGLIDEGGGVANAVLQNLGVDTAALTLTLEEHMKPGDARPTGPDLPFTSRAKKVIELAMAEARHLNHSYVGTEHMLIALAHKESGVTSEALALHGVDAASLTAESLVLLGTELPDVDRGRPAAPESATENLIFALSQVTGFTDACATHGDAATFAALDIYYALTMHVLQGSGARFVKAMGDGVLLVFRRQRAREAVDALRRLQALGTVHWNFFDERCRLQIKIGAGSAQCGVLGPPGARHLDIVGDALNKFFRTPWADFAVSDEVNALLK